MSSDKIDRWVKRNPESWAKLAELDDKKIDFETFKKKFKKGAEYKGKQHALREMTKQQLYEIYLASGKAITADNTETIKSPNEKIFTPRILEVSRNQKTYKRTMPIKWGAHTQLALKIAATKKQRSKEYKEIVQTLVKTTGRTRQAVVKKIQRTRKMNKP